MYFGKVSACMRCAKHRNTGVLWLVVLICQWSQVTLALDDLTQIIKTMICQSCERSAIRYPSDPGWNRLTKVGSVKGRYLSKRIIVLKVNSPAYFILYSILASEFLSVCLQMTYNAVQWMIYIKTCMFSLAMQIFKSWLPTATLRICLVHLQFVRKTSQCRTHPLNPG